MKFKMQEVYRSNIFIHSFYILDSGKIVIAHKPVTFAPRICSVFESPASKLT